MGAADCLPPADPLTAFVAFAFVLTSRFTLLMVTPLSVLFVTLGSV